MSRCPGDLARIRCGGHHDVRKPVRPDLDYDVSSVPVGEETSRRKRGRRRREGTVRPAGAADHTGRSRPAAAGDHCSRRQRPSHGRPRVRRRSAARRTGGADPHAGHLCGGAPPTRGDVNPAHHAGPARRTSHARPPGRVPSAPRAHAWPPSVRAARLVGPGIDAPGPPGQRPPRVRLSRQALAVRAKGEPVHRTPGEHRAEGVRPAGPSPLPAARPVNVPPGRPPRIGQGACGPGQARARSVRRARASIPRRASSAPAPRASRAPAVRAPTSSGRRFPCPRRAFPPPARRRVGWRGAPPRTPVGMHPFSPPGATSWPPSAPSAPPPPVPEPAAGSGPVW